MNTPSPLARVRSEAFFSDGRVTSTAALIGLPSGVVVKTNTLFFMPDTS